MDANGTQVESLNDAAAAVLRAWRGKKRWSVPRLAELSGIPKDTLQRYLLGTRPIPLAAFGSLAAAFGMPASQLMADVEKEWQQSVTVPSPREGGFTSPLGEEHPIFTSLANDLDVGNDDSEEHPAVKQRADGNHT